MEEANIVVSDIHDGNMRFFASASSESGAGDKASGEDNTNSESEIIRNQAQLASALGLSPEQTARVRTVYGERTDFTEYYVVRDGAAGNGSAALSIAQLNITHPEAKIPVSDGLATRSSEIGFLLPLADCLGIVFCDPTQKVIGLLHAGRHNVEQDGPRKFVEFLTREFGTRPEDLKVYFSPCAQNFEIEKLGGAKLPDAALKSLTDAGVLPKKITRAPEDTVTDPGLPSHSAGDKFMRFAIATRLR